MTTTKSAEHILQARVDAAVGDAFHELGDRMQAAGHFFAALPIYAEAEQRLGRVYGPGSFEATSASHRMALSYRETGALDQSLAKFRALSETMKATANTPQDFFDYVDECIADLQLRMLARRSMLAMLRRLIPATDWYSCVDRANKGRSC